MKKLLFLVLWSFITGFASIKAQQTIVVTGEIDILGDGELVSLVCLNGLNEVVAEDSASAKNFELVFQASQSNLYSLNFGDDDGFVIVLHPGDAIQIYMKELEININGSEENSKNAKVMMESNYLSDKYSLTYSEYLNTEDKNFQALIEDELTHLMDRYTKLIKGFINENPCSLLSLLYLEELNIDADLAFFQLAANCLTTQYPDNVHVIELKRKVEAKMRVANGNPAPEIALPDTNGSIMKLSDLKGNIVLIDFWASWCKPCRQESPIMVALYEKYNKSGLVILGVSLDKDLNSWLDAIQKDKLTWYHVSDLKGWDSVVCDDYSIGGIPYTAIIDKDGKILATGLRGETLEKKLEEIFGF
ncbi:MAG: TlpA family protein disulfide reductase [Bacteroidales bacterium]|nr:TlpA family protein disulfide reductase [Bacteroidales bacterium]HQP04029.1 TlpA disulfide reductase family protein [Bacteroidales bacterium]